MSFMYRIELKDGSLHIYESPESDPEPSDEYWEFFDNHRDEVVDLFSVHLTGLPISKEEKKQELCEDAISRQAVREFVQRIQKIKDDHNENGTPINYGIICDLVFMGWCLMQLPPVTPQPKMGHWIPAKVGKLFPSNDYKCSECGNILDFNGVNCGRGDASYCPNCGAQMTEGNVKE